MKHPWFGGKTFGYGLSPKGWRGWLAMGAFIVILNGFLIITPGLLVRVGVHPAWTALGALVLTVGFVAVAIATSDGEPWRWRWGRR